MIVQKSTIVQFERGYRVILAANSSRGMKELCVQISGGKPLLMGLMFPKLLLAKKFLLESSLNVLFSCIIIKRRRRALNLVKLSNDRLDLRMNISKMKYIPLLKGSLLRLDILT
jgi:hypothetical protein